ncbi:MAG: efflux RND transporter permease subunit, partial [Pseudomonadales bacterium]|nr:efflux RND transporter permease subunit [Pseudomonadales bacterium]
APVIKSENARLNAWVYVDLTTDDVGGFVARAKDVLAEQVEIPPGYTITWSGQFEYMERAAKRLRLVVPMTLVIIFLLLYLNFRNLTGPLLVMLSIPFALIGGIWLLYWFGFNLSVAVAVGFIALAGVAVETGVLVLTFINEALERARREAPGGVLSREQIFDSVYRGTSERVRPVMMTTATLVFGLLPIMIGTGTGSQVMQRIAAPMLGGIITTTILSLLILPAIYGLVLVVQERLLNKGIAVQSTE